MLQTGNFQMKIIDIVIRKMVDCSLKVNVLFMYIYQIRKKKYT